MVVHHFTVDVEEYFQVSALEPCVRFEDWPSQPSRVRGSVESLLALLAERSVRATFFVLGWVAERQPELIRDIAAAGHEVASHGWEHRRITRMSAEEFRASIRRAKRVVEDITGSEVIGYRAPSFSIVPAGEWALDVLLEEGYSYDSSLFPVHRPGYGYPGGIRWPHEIARPKGQLAEFPPSTLRRAGVNLPAAGGAYFRLLPFGLVGAALRQAERHGVPGTFYIHPWEIDPEQPRYDVPCWTRVRHYGGLRRTLPRLRRLLEEFRFGTIRANFHGAWTACSAP